jgi:hypothetical protein
MNTIGFAFYPRQELMESTGTPCFMWIETLVLKSMSFRDWTYPSHIFRSSKWVIAMGIVLNMLFVDTILASLFFADDNTCEGFKTKSDCLNLNSLDQINNLCVWDKHLYACSFNQNIGQ